MRTFGQSLHSVIRRLCRVPGFSATVVVTLALAIGANTAIFSLVNALMLARLPYPHPERMGTIFRRVQGVRPFDGPHGIDGKQWQLLRDDVPALLSAISGSTTGVNLQAGAHVAYVQDGRISQHYLDVLGIRPAAGRNFTAAEDTPHGPNAVILSYSLWHNVFGSDRSLVGQVIQLKGAPYTLIGILPRDATTPLGADVYTALQPNTQGEGGGSNYNVIARLSDGVTWRQADAEINRAWAGEATNLASDNHAAPVSFYLVPLQRGETAALRPKTLALMLAAGLILLIACANLAGLTLVRVARRTSEIATRLALGASRWQIVRQLWAENLVLAVAGGAVGVGVGFVALRGLLSLLPLGFLPVVAVPIDGTMLAFTLCLSLLTSLLFGMLPALSTRRIDLRSAMASRGVGSTERVGLRQTLIAGEVAFTVLLLAGSGLLVRTLVHLATLPPGFNPRGVMTAKASTLATQRVEVALLTAMAGLALLLSAVGIFSLVASLIAQKTREIGIRIALGSPVRRAMVDTASPGVRASAWGLIVGLILCAATLWILHSVLYGVDVYDWPTMLTVALVLAAVTLVAVAIPSLRVVRISPAHALRDE